MSEFGTLAVRIDTRGVAELRLNWPEKRNAMSGEMIAELAKAARRLGEDDGVRAVVLSGAGETFCAGADLGWMKAQIEADRESRVRAARQLAEMLKSLNELPKPLIGRVHGGAFGGGVGLACVCDVVIADEGAKFGFLETRLGLIPATIAPYVLARIGEGPARRVFMSARTFDAREAQDMGLIARAVPAGDLNAAVEAEVEPYLFTAPNAVGAAKALARSLGPPIDEAVIEQTVERLADVWETDEAREGVDAFLTGRRPRWNPIKG